MAKKSAKRPKNANRRLGDRLWTAEGQEYRRTVLDTYFVDGKRLSSMLAGQRQQYGLLRDHSAIEWLDERWAFQVAGSLSSAGCVEIEERTYRATLWQGAADGLVVLLEEDH